MLRLAVHNLPCNVVAWELREFFNSIAPLYTFNLQRGRDDSEETFALLTFNNDEDAKMVLRSCTNCTWAGIQLRVSKWEKNMKGPMNQPQSFQSKPPQGWGGGQQNNIYNSPWRNGNEPFQARQGHPIQDQSDLILQNLAEESRNINERIAILQNSMRMTANNIYNLGGETPPPKRQKVFYADGPNFHRGPSTSFERNPIRTFHNQPPGKLNAHGIKKGPGIKPVKRLTNTVAKSVPWVTQVGSQTNSNESKSFDRNLVHKIIMCYGNLFGLSSMNSIKALAEKKVLTPEMVKYVSNGKVEVDADGKITKDGTVKENSKTVAISKIEIDKQNPDIGIISANSFSDALRRVAYNNCPEMSKNQKLKIFKSLKLFKKKCRKVFRDHMQDHRFVDALQKEAPEDLTADLLQGWVPPTEPNEFDKLPKCPEPPEHYFSIEKYYEEMREFFAKFSTSDYLSYNYFKRIFSCSPPIPKHLSKDIIFCVQVLGIYSLKDKKFVLKALAKDDTPLIIIKTEPTLLLGFITEEEQMKVLKRHGERINHVKLYLKSYKPEWYVKAPKKMQTYYEHHLQLNPEKQRQLKCLFYNIVKVFAPHIKNKDLPAVDNSDPKWNEIPDIDEFAIFKEEDNYNNEIDDDHFAIEDLDGDCDDDKTAASVDTSMDQSQIASDVSVDTSAVKLGTVVEKSDTPIPIVKNEYNIEETTEGTRATSETDCII